MNPNLQKLKAFVRGLPDPAAREAFATSCGTTINYLRKVLSKQHFVPDAALCIAIERESKGAVRCEDLRPDVDWSYLRKTDCPVPMEKAA
ncbi:MAG TPA: YdaS family helix-turn-helix protein [Luteimonas sp.]